MAGRTLMSDATHVPAIGRGCRGLGLALALAPVRPRTHKPATFAQRPHFKPATHNERRARGRQRQFVRHSVVTQKES